MPCNSDYLEPRGDEVESQRCAECLVYVFKSINIECPKWIEEASKNVYGNSNKIDILVVSLCKLCTKMTEKEKAAIIYDGKSKQSRKLADWWEEHQEADRERIKEEKQEANKKAARKRALSKLTKKEIEALDIR